MKPEEKLKKLYDSLKNKRSIFTILRAKKNLDIVKMLNDRFPMLKDKKYGMGIKIYWFINNIKDFPLCIECGKPNTTNRCSIYGYYTEFCSRKCGNGKIARERFKKACLEKFGVENPLKCKKIHEKQIKTTIKKYGVDNVSKLESIVKKIEKTKLEKYGDKYYTNPEKAKETNKKRYGVENPFDSDIFQKKAKETMVRKYGVEHTLQIKSIYEKVTKLTALRSIHNSYENYLRKNPFSEPNFSEEFYFEHRRKVSGNYEFEFKCRKCGGIFKSRINCGSIRRCPKCYSQVTTSGKEQELHDFLESIYHGKIVRKDRTVLGNLKELDLYLPERNLAIEFDGLYWHSELNGIKKNYHLEKTRRCEEKGIRLVHVFEDEWEFRQDTVKSILSEILESPQKEIDSRECILRKLSPEEEYFFLDGNHLLGKVASFVCYGLEFRGEIVSLLSFSKRRIGLGKKSESGEFDVQRFCRKNGISVEGDAGRMLEEFEKEFSPRKIFWNVDRRWFSGDLQKSLGFSLEKETYPNYWYLPNGCETREHRYRYRKNVQKDILEEFDPGLSEWENMRNNKFTRIWDCGNLVFSKAYG